MIKHTELNKPFNVGDKVVNLRFLHLWNDAFHHVHFLNDSVHLVSNATDEFFTFNPLVEIPESLSLNSYVAQHIYQQSTGVCIADGAKHVLSVEREFPLIKSALDSAFALAMQKVDDENKNIIIDPTQYSAEAGGYHQALHTKNTQYFAKKEFLFERFQEVVNHLFAK